MTLEQADLLARWRVWCDEEDSELAYWRYKAERALAEGCTGIDPTKTVAHTVSVAVYRD